MNRQYSTKKQAIIIAIVVAMAIGLRFERPDWRWNDNFLGLAIAWVIGSIFYNRRIMELPKGTLQYAIRAVHSGVTFFLIAAIGSEPWVLPAVLVVLLEFVGSYFDEKELRNLKQTMPRERPQPQQVSR